MLNTQPTPKSDPNRWLFVASATGIAAMMFMGFAKNYYLRFWFGTRVISVMVHIHGLIMTAWVVLFLTQTLLVANRRTDLHRKFGLAGASLAIIVVGLGVYTIAGSIVRQHLDTTARTYALAFVAFDGLSLLLFGGLVLTALGLRSRPQPHKRLMLMAMISLLPPAFGRFVAYFAPDNERVIVPLLMCGSVLLCVFIDTRRNRRLHPAFAWSGALVLLANLLTYFAQIVD